MKKRFTIHKAGWTNTREEQYRKDCDKLLSGINAKLLIRKDKVYLQYENREILFLEIGRPKSMWYEIWLKLKPEITNS